MDIRLDRDNLLISGFNGFLNSRHKSQLNFWGFIWDEKSNSYSCFYSLDLLVKIFNYFEKQKLKVVFDQYCINLLNQHKLNEKAFKEINDLCKDYKDGIYDIENLNSLRKFLLENIKRPLKEHQIKAFIHLILCKNGANFSVPGSGKTTVVLSAFEKLRIENKVNTLFVIGSSSCFGPWKDEYELVLGKKPKSLVLAGLEINRRKLAYFENRDYADLYLITFQTLLNDQIEVIKFLNNKHTKAFIVIDEAHYIKKINGNWANAIKNISGFSSFRCILTGTPMPHGYSDLFNLFEFLWPKERIFTEQEKLLLEKYEKEGSESLSNKLLKNKIGPLFYRVRKSDLGLAPQRFHKIYIDMGIIENKIYDAIVTKIRDFSKTDYLINIDLINKLIRGRIIRLRQCLSYPKLLSTAIDDYGEDIVGNDNDLKKLIVNYDKFEIPSKIICLLDSVRKLVSSGNKVVVWSHFINTTKLIERHLYENGFISKKIIGEVPIENESIELEVTREKIVREFNNVDSNLQVLIANPAACSESISLHKACNNAIYYDLSFNCAQYLQSLDRIHRVGGSETRESNYFILQYKNTIDDYIYSNLLEKERKMISLIESDYSIYSLDMSEPEIELNIYNNILLNA